LHEVLEFVEHLAEITSASFVSTKEQLPDPLSKEPNDDFTKGDRHLEMVVILGGMNSPARELKSPSRDSLRSARRGLKSYLTRCQLELGPYTVFPNPDLPSSKIRLRGPYPPHFVGSSLRFIN
jgi:hypothetical protein